MFSHRRERLCFFRGWLFAAEYRCLGKAVVVRGERWLQRTPCAVVHMNGGLRAVLLWAGKTHSPVEVGYGTADC